jgi:hypothetical protein
MAGYKEVVGHPPNGSACRENDIILFDGLLRGKSMTDAPQSPTTSMTIAARHNQSASHNNIMSPALLRTSIKNNQRSKLTRCLPFGLGQKLAERIQGITLTNRWIYHVSVAALGQNVLRLLPRLDGSREKMGGLII